MLRRDGKDNFAARFKILTDGVTPDDLILGDKNAVMVASRILAYGPEYSCEISNPKSGELINHTFNLADCPFKKIPNDVDISGNEFQFKLPVSKINLVFRLLTGKDERLIAEELEASKKTGSIVTPELTTRLRYSIVSVDGDNSPAIINQTVQNMLAKDSIAFREEMKRVAPDIELTQDADIGGETVKVNIPMTVSFFWPTS